MPRFATQYTHELNHKSGERTMFTSQQPSRTKQSFAKDADINNIVARFLKTGQLPDNIREGGWTSQDFTQAPQDYQTALHQIRAAQSAFHALPAKLRDLFNNDPAQLEHWLANPKNKEQAIEYGLIKKPVAAAPSNSPAPVPAPGPESTKTS